MYSTFGEHKSAIAERFNRTLKTIIAHYFTSHNTHRWVDKLQDFVDTYNNRIHSSIGMTPTAPTEAMSIDTVPQLPPHPQRPVRNALNVGDHVRISRLKGVFEKGYNANWNDNRQQQLQHQKQQQQQQQQQLIQQQQPIQQPIQQQQSIQQQQPIQQQSIQNQAETGALPVPLPFVTAQGSTSVSGTTDTAATTTMDILVNMPQLILFSKHLQTLWSQRCTK